MLNKQELTNALVFLTTGKWNLNAQEANELLHLTKRFTELTTEKVEETKTEKVQNG